MAIDQDRLSFEIVNDFGGCRKGHRRNNHLIAGSDSDSLKGQMQRGGARVDRHGVLGADIALEGFLELPNSWPRSQPAGLQTVHHFPDFFVSEEWFVKGEKFLSHYTAPKPVIMTLMLRKMILRSSQKERFLIQNKSYFSFSKAPETEHVFS